jgi:hypothetical protein
MDEPLSVGGGEALGRLKSDAENCRQVHRALAESGLERFARHELHDEEREAAFLADGVDGDHMLVGDGGGGACLAQEPGPRGFAGGEDRGEDFDGDDTGEAGVPGFEDDSHTAAGHTFEHVVAGESSEASGRQRRGQQFQGRRREFGLLGVPAEVRGPELFHHVRQGDGLAMDLGQGARRRNHVLGAGQAVESTATGRAGFEMRAEEGEGISGQGIVEESA